MNVPHNTDDDIAMMIDAMEQMKEACQKMHRCGDELDNDACPFCHHCSDLELNPDNWAIEEQYG